MTAETNHPEPPARDCETPDREIDRESASAPAPATGSTGSASAASGDPPSPQPTPRVLIPLPGLAAIALYLLLLAGTIVVGVAAGRRYPPVFLVFSALFFAACGGLLMLFRWAWALALAAVGLLAGYNLWIFSTRGIAPALVQGLLNLVFFFYLIRPEVREKLR
jgi:hypothetical protein